MNTLNLKPTQLITSHGPVTVEWIDEKLGLILCPSRKIWTAISPVIGEDIELACLDRNLPSILVQEVQAEWLATDPEDAPPHRLLILVA